MRKLLMTAALAGVFFCGSDSARAGIVTLSGDISFIPTPSTLNYTDNFNFTSSPSLVRPDAVIFAERLAFSVPDFHSIDPSIPPGSSINYQISAPGTYAPGALGDTPLAAGTVVDTYIVHWGPENRLNHISGSIVFDRPIFAIQMRFCADCVAEDLFTLPDLSFRASSGLEIGFGDSLTEDTLVLSPDRMTLTFDFHIDGATENMRIIFVPEPSTIAIFVTGVLLFWSWSWMPQIRLRKAR